MQHRICNYVLSATIIAAISPAQAVDLALPGVNTGATSFEDGGGGVGHMFQTSNSRFDASRSYDAEGHKRPIAYDRALWIARLHYAYTSLSRAFGGNLGTELIVPLLDLDLNVGPAHISGSGISNPSIGGYVQWRDKRYPGIGRILWRAGMVNSAATVARQRRQSSLLLTPDLVDIDLLGWHQFDQAIALGYLYAVRAVEAGKGRLNPP